MEEDMTLLLPDDLLADVLRRVAPCDLAVSRCVCRAWRALIDDLGLLRTDLLPLSLAGIFLRLAFLEDYEEDFLDPELFARPQVDITYSMPDYIKFGHCNGLVLELEYDAVFNPATGGRAILPKPSDSFSLNECYFWEHQHLAFDPTVSPHYEVFRVPCVHYRYQVKVHSAYNMLLLQSEWPPSLFVMRVFSSRTGRWEERSFVREGEAAGTVAGLRESSPPRHSVYSRGALYIQYHNDFVVRLSFSDHKCRVIKPPTRTGIKCRVNRVQIGKSEKGVYYALLDDENQLWVWILQGSGEQMEWTLKHHSRCALLDLLSLSWHQRVHSPWILQNASSCSESASNKNLRGANNKTSVKQEYEWNSDDDESILPAEDRVQKHDTADMYLEILGFHPYKEIVFLGISTERGLAYHLNSSKLQDLGNLRPKNHRPAYLDDSFPYTPCWTGDL